MDITSIRDPEMIMSSLLAFFVALVIALVFSALFRKFRIPWAVALILGGIVMGPHGLGFFQLNEIILFLSEIGVIFLMFIAGMETKISAIKEVWKESSIIALVSGIVPALVGVAIGLLFGFGIITALLLGIIFMSSSFAVVIPTLESKGILNYRIGRVIVSSTVIQDIASLILLAVLLMSISPETLLPWPIMVITLLAAIAGGIVIRKYITQFRQWLATLRKRGEDSYFLFEQELTLVVVILIGTAIIFEIFKMETIVGAFFAGLILAEISRSKILENKIHILGYGIFIPIFFVTVGGWTNLGLLVEEASKMWPLVLSILFGSVITKFGSGYLSAKWLGFTSYKSALIGITSIPQLITTLAVVLVGQNLGLIPPQLGVAIVILSISTTLISPLITAQLLNKKPDTFLQ